MTERFQNWQIKKTNLETSTHSEVVAHFYCQLSVLRQPEMHYLCYYSSIHPACYARLHVCYQIFMITLRMFMMENEIAEILLPPLIRYNLVLALAPNKCIPDFV